MDQFLLKWNNHQSNFVDVFGQLLDQEAFTDVTLAAEGRTFLAHKLVLSACSPYLRDILERNPCKHPVVFLRGVSAAELHLLLQYIYRGEAHVRQDQLPDLLRTATDLQIKGLASVGGGSEPRPGADPDLHPYPSPPLSTPSKGPPAALLTGAGARPLALSTALSMGVPPPPAVLDTLRLPLLNKLGATTSERESAPQDSPRTTPEEEDDTSEDGAMPLITSIKTEEDEVQGETSMATDSCPDSGDSSSAGGGAQAPSPAPPAPLATGARLLGGAPMDSGGMDNAHIQSLIAQLASPRAGTGGAKKGPYTCRYCGETFKAKEHLNRHERIHTGERPFPCVLCGKRFSRKDHLKIHVLIHTGEKPYSCTMCNKRFTQKQTLIEHENVHLGRKPFRCDLCDASFPARGNLKYHKRSVHGCALNTPASRSTPAIETASE
ncbi:zinc finger protein 467-like [Amphibalanus amphitrite]|uniref:zinc finger protein 467-like n=1 Tax=Amphibalanus amphitrite TaxID=1232801 RepID=UPI001C904D97|nr:zinc finger protein 467-like [Amphibalanus amphitrite]XP_043247513.1 zinc finger protein 467-like [Amphibalanus amphitrite]XP_043247514.1 zinc finger protein 467-like [Amphibalanus amphitrite]